MSRMQFLMLFPLFACVAPGVTAVPNRRFNNANRSKRAFMETAPIFKEVWPRIAPPEINGATIIVTDCFQRLDEEAYGYTIILKAVTSSASLGCPLQLPENAEVRLINVEKEDENGFVKTYISSQHGELKEIREIGYTESNSNNKGYSMLLFFPNSRIDRLFFQMRDRDEDEF